MGNGNRIRSADLANLSAAVSRIQLTIERFADTDSAGVFRGPEPPRAGYISARCDGFKGGPRLAKALELKRQKDIRAEVLDRKINLIGDPIWNLLLELFIAQCRQEQVTISTASTMMSIPMTTALRYITYCENKNFAERQDDPFDRRRCFLVLTPEGNESICAYLDAI